MDRFELNADALGSLICALADAAVADYLRDQPHPDAGNDDARAERVPLPALPPAA
jgi:hypothetical protein